MSSYVYSQFVDVFIAIIAAAAAGFLHLPGISVVFFSSRAENKVYRVLRALFLVLETVVVCMYNVNAIDRGSFILHRSVLALDRAYFTFFGRGALIVCLLYTFSCYFQC